MAWGLPEKIVQNKPHIQYSAEGSNEGSNEVLMKVLMKVLLFLKLLAVIRC